MMGIMLLMILGVLAYAGQGRERAIRVSRKVDRHACASAGFQIARGFYGRDYDTWNYRLSRPAIYDSRDPVGAGLEITNPELFADLDGDNKADVYFYMRDNTDERPPAHDNGGRDSDQAIIVGAQCISSTMRPALPSGQLDSTVLVVEGLLEYNVKNTSTGNGNYN